jgi:hypothetical protein
LESYTLIPVLVEIYTCNGASLEYGKPSRYSLEIGRNYDANIYCSYSLGARDAMPQRRSRDLLLVSPRGGRKQKHLCNVRFDVSTTLTMASSEIRRVALVRTDVSEKLSASFIKLPEILN